MATEVETLSHKVSGETSSRNTGVPAAQGLLFHVPGVSACNT